MSGLLGGNKSQSTTVQRYLGIQITQSAYGQPIPLAYGTCRGAASLGWYGDFVSTPHSQSQGGKGGGNQTPSSYTYTAAMLMFLCEGQIAGIGTVWDGKKQMTLAALNLTLFTGATGQAIWSYLSSNHPTQAIPYSDICFVAAAPYNLGSSAGMPNLSYEIQGLNIYGSGIVDAEPSAVLTDYCTSTKHGANFPYLGVLTGANSFQQWCVSNGMFISYNENTQRPAVDFIKEILQVTNSASKVDGLGNVTFIPYADSAVSGNGGSYTPNMTPLFAFTDDDFIASPGQEPVVLTRTSAAQTFNVVNVEYEDRSQQYNRSIATAYDDADIAQNGQRVMQTVSLPCIKTATLARLVAQLILHRQLYYRTQYTFKVRPDYCLLEPMDLVSITDSGLGVTNALCRIIKITDNANDELELTCEEVPIGPATAPLYNWQAMQGYAQDYNVAPGAVNAPYLFLVPAGLSTDGQCRIGIAVNGPANGVWGGCNVWVSFDGTNYEQFAVVNSPARYGTLTAAFATGNDPDTTNTCSVTLNRSDLTLTGGAQADADQMRTMCIVDGEIISFETATFVSAGKYNLTTYLRRGCYGSTIGAHLINANWARLDQAIVTLPFDPGMAGTTISFKFQSFNIFGHGLESLASDTVYTYTPPAGQALGTSQGWTCAGTAVAMNNRVFKSPAGTVNTWDSIAYGKPITGPMWVQARLPSVSSLAGANANAIMLGLTTTPATVSYTGATYGLIYGNNSGTPYLSVYESGIGQFSLLTGIAPGDLIEIRYDGKCTYYYHNGTVIWTTRAVQTAPMYPAVYCVTPSFALFDITYGSGTQSAAIAAGTNYLGNASWVPGKSGTQGNFQDTGPGGTNSIILGDGSSATKPLGPYGTSEVLWQGVGVATSGTGGGFINSNSNVAAGSWLQGDIAGIDPSKTYRVSIWVRYHGSTTGGPYIYFGWDAGGATADVTTLAVDSNPYMCYGALANLAPDKWYLVTGILHGVGYAGGQTGLSGLWDPVTGQRNPNMFGDVAGASPTYGADFVIKSSAVLGQTLRVFAPYMSTTGGSNATLVWLCKPRFEEMNGNEPSIWSLLHPTPTVDPSSGLVLALGSVPPMVQDGLFSYTSTTSSIDVTWPAYKVYRPDGTNFTTTAGGQNVTGLSASTTYTGYVYSAESAPGTLGMISGGSGQVGTPAALFPPTATTAQTAAALAVCAEFQNMYQGKFTGATPASGSGGGSGGGGGFCPHPDQLIETPDAPSGRCSAGDLRVGMRLYTPTGTGRITQITRPVKREWIQVVFDSGEEALVTAEHRFMQPDETLIRTRDMTLGTVIASNGARHVEVVAMRMVKEPAQVVALELEEPRLYMMRKRGAISHNIKDR